MTSRTPAATRRQLLKGLAALPWAGASLAAGGEPSRLIVEALFFRQPGAPPVAATPSGTTGASLAPLVGGLRRAGYTLVGELQTTLSIGAGATGAARLEDILPGASLSGRLSVTRGQILVVSLTAHCADCGATGDLDERRRVKFGERHYFDGPVISAIVTVNPAPDSALPG